MPKYIVPLITSFYEYQVVEAESPEEAVLRAKDAEGDTMDEWTEFREVIAIGEDVGEIEELKDGTI